MTTDQKKVNSSPFARLEMIFLSLLLLILLVVLLFLIVKPSVEERNCEKCL